MGKSKMTKSDGLCMLVFLTVGVLSSAGIAVGAAIGHWYGWGMFGASIFALVWAIASMVGMAVED